MKKAGVEDWLTTFRKRKWTWAARILQDCQDRWTTRIFGWQPREGVRCVGHPKLRWSDAFASYGAQATNLSDGWIYLLSDRNEARTHLPGFLLHCSL